jgi:hypothetical protein
MASKAARAPVRSTGEAAVAERSTQPGAKGPGDPKPKRTGTVFPLRAREAGLAPRSLRRALLRAGWLAAALSSGRAAQVGRAPCRGLATAGASTFTARRTTR